MYLTKPTRAALVMPLVASLGVIALGSCSDRKTVTTTPAPSTTSSPGPVPTSTPTTSTSAPVIAPGTAEDVTKKGTSTGMIGGESGTVAASGKPGTGTDSGAGTGASKASGSETTDKK